MQMFELFRYRISSKHDLLSPFWMSLYDSLPFYRVQLRDIKSSLIQPHRALESSIKTQNFHYNWITKLKVLTWFCSNFVFIFCICIYDINSASFFISIVFVLTNFTHLRNYNFTSKDLESYNLFITIKRLLKCYRFCVKNL